MVSTTDLSDSRDGAVQHCAPIFTNFGARTHFAGPIATVVCLEDNVLLEQALSTVPPGTVVVVDGGGSRRSALLGDRLAGIAADRDLPAIIINGCVRDTAELAGFDVALLALGANPKRSAKAGRGQRDVTLAFGGVLWTPGATAYGDTDGVILSDQPLDDA